MKQHLAFHSSAVSVHVSVMLSLPSNLLAYVLLLVLMTLSRFLVYLWSRLLNGSAFHFIAILSEQFSLF